MLDQRCLRVSESCYMISSGTLITFPLPHCASSRYLAVTVFWADAHHSLSRQIRFVYRLSYPLFVAPAGAAPPGMSAGVEYLPGKTSGTNDERRACVNQGADRPPCRRPEGARVEAWNACRHPCRGQRSAHHPSAGQKYGEAFRDPGHPQV